jgi:hypothetical protein
LLDKPLQISCGIDSTEPAAKNHNPLFRTTEIIAHGFTFNIQGKGERPSFAASILGVESRRLNCFRRRVVHSILCP